MHTNSEKVFVVALMCYSVDGIIFKTPGPWYPATSGEIWPLPQYQQKYLDYYIFHPKEFALVDATGINEISGPCKELDYIMKVSMELVLEMYLIAKRTQDPDGTFTSEPVKESVSYIKELKIKLITSLPRQNLCPAVVPENMNETYILNITDVNAELKAYSLWGIVRGLTTFTQAFYIAEEEAEVRLNSTMIRDFPRYSHRGIMLDTARHYISVPKIKQIINAMKLNKLNVLHWHLVDDPSCPYKSLNFPELSDNGAFHYESVYTQSDVQHIIQYAKAAAIRVIPEVNVPGHVKSWGAAFPALLTDCTADGNKGPIDFLGKSAFDFLRVYFNEVDELFEDAYFHIGGSTVDLDCWLKNRKYQLYMKDMNLTSGNDLLEIFTAKLLDILPKHKKVIVWQEVVQEGLDLPEGSLVQVWKDDSSSSALLRGYKVVYSTCFQFHSAKRETDLYSDFYNCDPAAGIEDSNLLSNLVGGEAIFWSDRLDDTNINNKIWPRGSAMAERLWSDSSKLPSKLPHNRLNEQLCRMKRIQVPVHPLGAGHCTCRDTTYN